jgi:hypothetical protein
MKVTLRQDRLTIDMPSVGLVIAALETASMAWLDHAADNVDNTDERKKLLLMAGQAKALAILIEAKQNEPVQQEMPL